jgi:ATP-binding cassette subfamily F protein uup
MLRIDELNLRYGARIIFKECQFSIEEKERVCIIGRNGAGKSTLLNIITGKIEADSIEIHTQRELRISKLEQELPKNKELTVRELVYQGLSKQLELIEQYQQFSEIATTDEQFKQLSELHSQIDAAGAWHIEQQIDSVLTEMNLSASQKLSELSGGWQRRAALAKALVSNPDLLLLDEPTNHLDLAAIDWLEKRLQSYQGAILFITHDRSFLKRLATRIIEIDRTKIYSWQGNYNDYLKNKELANHSEDKNNQDFDKKLQQEEIWIRQGIKARRTRNEGRVRALEEMRQQASERIKRERKAKIRIQEGDLSGKKVIEAFKLCKSYQNNVVLDKFNLRIFRGERIGLIGNNGVGKSTLLKILLKKIAVDSGTVKLGTNLQMGYFDQVQRDLLLNKTVAYNVGDGSDYVEFNGKLIHVIGYLKNFLFSPDRSMTKVSALSGGERNRVALAKLFTSSTNFLILDEPTNDLDIEMLDALEQTLIDYQGTIILVSHDREFLDNVVTSTLVFEENNQITAYPGGYSDWLRHGKELKNLEYNVKKTTDDKKPKTSNKPKISYVMKKELEKLPNQIDKIEKKIQAIEEVIGDPEFYQKSHEQQQPELNQLDTLKKELDKLNIRWEELESLAS